MNPANRLPIEVRGSAAHPLGMSPARFLRDYWQKRPLLIRQAFADFQPPLQPDDLAGLACEDGALARLIIHDEKRDRWHVNPGPLSEADFSKTPNSNWTLLVQDVDKWDTDVAGLLDHFSFLPSWRLDDIMVSYAEPGGGVGAHVDQYDVFLLQGLGQRHWAISDDPMAPKEFRHDVELKQLARFEPTHEWLLEPGDMLYLPPGVPHDGVAFGGPCMTFSIGMRAPSQAELTGDLADHLAEHLPDELRYADPDLKPARATGEIDRAAIERLKMALPFAAVLRDNMLRDWFGRFITRYRNAQVPAPLDKPLGEDALAKQLAAGAQLLRHPWSRLAWSQGKSGCTLFVSGHAYQATPALAQQLCEQRMVSVTGKPNATERALLLALVNDGHLLPEKIPPPMKLQNFHVETAEWSREDQRAALLDLRDIVFIREQGVPEARERDGLDVDCWHVLARDEVDQPIGCGRLTPAHKIGRMAVLPAWRGQGVGMALLRELIARARTLGWPEVALDAQVSALGFYEREGFVPYGDEFEDAGLPHLAMRMTLPASAADDAPLRDIGALPAGSRSDTAAARLQLLGDARHRLAMYLPLLNDDSYASTEELAELRRIAISGRGAQIRILLHDPAAALRSDHRLIALAQRLPSAIQIRMPVEEADLAYVSAYLLNDVGGYLFLPEANRPQGRAALHDRASHAPLQQHFDEVWERAERASILQALDI